MGREGHLAHGREQAAVGSVVIGENQALSAQRLYCSEKVREQFRLLQIGAWSPHWLDTCARIEPPRRLRPRPDPEEPIPSHGIGSQLRGQRPAHVLAGANADTIKDKGAITSLALPPSSQAVRIERESLPPEC